VIFICKTFKLLLPKRRLLRNAKYRDLRGDLNVKMEFIGGIRI
jgi:hypothetical protein